MGGVGVGDKTHPAIYHSVFVIAQKQGNWRKALPYIVAYQSIQGISILHSDVGCFFLWDTNDTIVFNRSFFVFELSGAYRFVFEAVFTSPTFVRIFNRMKQLLLVALFALKFNLSNKPLNRIATSHHYTHNVERSLWHAWLDKCFFNINVLYYRKPLQRHFEHIIFVSASFPKYKKSEDNMFETRLRRLSIIQYLYI